MKYRPRIRRSLHDAGGIIDQQHAPTVDPHRQAIMIGIAAALR
jgi:hypothetical protein